MTDASANGMLAEPRPLYKYCCLLFPFPPTVNGLYAGGSRGRFKNKRYVQWEAEATLMLAKQKAEHFDSPVKVTISYGRPDRRVRDLLNYDKALMDFICPAILASDSLIHHATLLWDNEVTGAMLEIETL